MKKQLAIAAFWLLNGAAFFAQTFAPLVVVCFDDCADFELPDGSSIQCQPGLRQYPVVFKAQNGQDSMVIFAVNVLAPIIVSQNLTVCAGDEMPPPCLPCVSADGCDSLVQLNLTIVQVNAIINGGGAMHCAGPPKMLGSIASVGQKTWSNLKGQPLGTGDSFAAPAPGRYILTVKQAISAFKSCIARDTVEIFSLDPPIKKILATVHPVSLPSSATGAIAVDSVVGGTPPFSFFWSTGATAAAISSLKAGPFSVEVVDSLGCEKAAFFTLLPVVAPPPPPDTLAGKGPTEFVVFPNPTDGSARLFWPKSWTKKGNEKGFEIALFRADGRLVRRAFFDRNNNDFTEIELENEPPGLFWLAVKRGDGSLVFHQKIIKI